MEKLITWYEQKEKGVYVIKKFMLITFFFFLSQKIVNVIRLLLIFFLVDLKVNKY